MTMSIRFMLIAKSAETNTPPDAKLMAAVGQMAQEMSQSGVLVGMAGLMPTASGAEARLRDGRITIKDGPFSTANEVVGGYAMVDVNSKAEALDLAKRFLQIHADILGPNFQMVSEIRQVFV
jgi:hypothetical protein